jgi:hypothetical protein
MKVYGTRKCVGRWANEATQEFDSSGFVSGRQGRYDLAGPSSCSHEEGMMFCCLKDECDNAHLPLRTPRFLSYLHRMLELL